MKNKKIDPSLKIIAAPLLVVIACAAAFGMILNSTMPSIRAKFGLINESKKSETALNERLDTLKNFQSGVLDDHSDVIYSVFPDRNPGAMMLSQIKTISSEDTITLKKIEFASPEIMDGKIEKSNAEFDFESADFGSILRFLGKLARSAPLSTYEEINFVYDGGSVQTKLKSTIYWSELPTGLPALTEAVRDLSQEEKMLLNKIYSYRVPEFVNLEPQVQEIPRENPFN